MKKYSKPALMTLSISANDMLCQGCGERSRDPAVLGYLRSADISMGDNGIYDTSDLIGYFTDGESDCQTPVLGLETYCKFNPDDTYRLFLS